mgnify:CR=1 FL=1
MEFYFTALLMGLMGAGHCAAMCGSLTVAVGFSIPKERSMLFSAFLMSSGRILGYGIIGVAANLFAQSFLAITGGSVLYLSILAGILLFLVGMHIANLNSLILKTEILGALIQPLIQPIKQRLTPIDNNFKCLAYGFFWGFLPCGLVYSALSLALVSPTAMSGGLVMLFFGLGTLPTLVGLTSFSVKINGMLQQQKIRLALGVVVMAMGLYHISVASIKINHIM